MFAKDVKIGFVVGGILIATLIAYLLVAGKSKPKAVELAEGESVQQVQPVGSESSPAPTPEVKKEEPVTTPEAPKTETKPETVATGDTKTTDPFQPAPAGRDVWSTALNSGTVLMSVTPTSPVGTPAVSEPAAANSGAVTTEAKMVSDSVPSLIDNPQTTVPTTVTDNKPTTVAPPVRTAPTGRQHVVKSGETLTMISIAAYGDQKYWKQIASANPTINADKLKVGQTINLPELATKKEVITAPLNGGVTVPVNSRTEYEVVAGDSLHRIAQKLYGKDAMWAKIYELNKAAIGSNPAKLKLHMKLKLPAAPTLRA